jgi:CDP-diacylglycerol--serine O-phosphatidyltransferase
MAGVMVITMPMFSLKAKSLSFADNWYRYLFVFVAVALIAGLNVYGLALVIFAYILLNAVFYLLKVKF